MSYRIAPGVAPRLYFVVLDSTGEPVTDLAVADITSIAYRTITGGVAGATSSGLSLTAAAVTDAHSTGSTGPVRASDGWYFCDAPVGAADANADEVELVVVLDEATHVVYPSRHAIDVKVATRATQTSVDAVRDTLDQSSGEAY